MSKEEVHVRTIPTGQPPALRTEPVDGRAHAATEGWAGEIEDIDLTLIVLRAADQQEKPK